MISQEYCKSNKIVIQKYGGSSLADIEKINHVACKVAVQIKMGKKVIVVVSAMGKSTDNLIKIAKCISINPNLRELDMLLATGEQASAALLTMALHKLKLKSKSLNAFQTIIYTEGNFSNARIKNIELKKILTLIEINDVIVITGFQGLNQNGELTTLGRGGSDITAVALAAALKTRCEIYSDVDGIYTIDPKLNKNARKLIYISYDEMLELASSGAKVLHYRAVEIAKKFNITIYCASTFSDEKGSYVLSEKNIIEREEISGLSVSEEQTLVTLRCLPMNYLILKNIFNKLSENGYEYDMLNLFNSENGSEVSFTIAAVNKDNICNILNKNFNNNISNYKIEFISGYIKLSIIGIGLKTNPILKDGIIYLLKEIPLRQVITSEIKIVCLLKKEFKKKALNILIRKLKLTNKA